MVSDRSIAGVEGIALLACVDVARAASWLDHPYGERQYVAEDPGGHRWTFSQSLVDVDPASWGGTPVDLS